MANGEQAKLDRLQMPAIGDLVDGRYRIQSVIASGGMGVILRAEQLPMERPVAIKLLHPHVAAADPTVVERFQQEVRLAKLLNHPNTIRLYDFGRSDDGLVYVAMEYLEGHDLKELLKDQGALPVNRAVDITLQMLDGLAEAHAHDFIHRDLKPSNVFVCEDRRGRDVVKLLDFGIAKALDGTDSELTATGSICGTPGYVAPEYLRNESLLEASDIYAVGLMLLEMLTGRRVFQAEAPAQTMLMHLQLEPEIPPSIERLPVAAVIRRATAKQADQRYPDAEGMLRALEAIVDQLPAELSVSDDGPPSEPSRIGGRDGAGRPSGTPPSLPSARQGPAQDSSVALPEPPQNTPPLMASQSSTGLERPASLADNQSADDRGGQPNRDGWPTAEIHPADTYVTSPNRRRLVVIAAALLGAVAVVWIISMAVLSSNDRPNGGDKVATQKIPQSHEAQHPPPRRPPADRPAHRDMPAAGRAQAGPLDGHPDEPPAAGGTHPAEDAPDRPATVDKLQFKLGTQPTGAVASVDHETIGPTPVRYEATPDQLPQTVVFELDGYRHSEVELNTDGPTTVNETLEKKPSKPVHHAASRRTRRHDSSRQPAADHADSDRHISDKKVEKVLDEYLSD